MGRKTSRLPGGSQLQRPGALPAQPPSQPQADMPAEQAAGQPNVQAPAEAPQPFDSAAFLASLPNLPGVYRMLNAQGEALYVGKARDLKKRVSSYFQKGGHGPRIATMLTHVAAMEVSITRSEGEALILENNLIKSLNPRYNILFRDDKSYPYLMVSGHAFPRLGFHRGALDKANRYFGPFPHAGAVRESIQLLQRVFRIRTCEDSVFQNRSRPCLLHQIRRCTAPCVGLIDEQAYARDVGDARMFLEGRSDDVLKRLTERMLKASDEQRYEEAAVVRDQVQSLTRMTQRQYADNSGFSGNDSDVDVIAYAEEGGIGCVNLMMIRGGLQLGDRSFFPGGLRAGARRPATENLPHPQPFSQGEKGENPTGAEHDHAPLPPGEGVGVREEGDSKAEVLQAFIAQHYLERPVPAVIVCAGIEDVEETAALLSEHSGHRVHLVARPQGERRVWLEMAEENARQALKLRLTEQSTQEARLAALREALGLPETAGRIECFDISHTQGEATVASCVVYDRMDMQRGEYRRFNITGIEPGDDYAAMRQALTRRYSKVAGGEGVAPDLLLIDGGKGQLGVAVDALTEVGLHNLCIVGVAKGPERTPGMEELWLDGGRRSVRLGPGHAGLHLVQQVRDEAHRFAITGHRAKRGKARITSSLEGINGVGSKRRRQLLAQFGGLKGVMGASVDDLAKVQGISRTLAERIYRELHAA